MWTEIDTCVENEPSVTIKLAGGSVSTFSANLDSELLRYKNIMSDKPIATEDKILNSGNFEKNESIKSSSGSIVIFLVLQVFNIQYVTYCMLLISSLQIVPPFMYL